MAHRLSPNYSLGLYVKFLASLSQQHAKLNAKCACMHENSLFFSVFVISIILLFCFVCFQPFFRSISIMLLRSGAGKSLLSASSPSSTKMFFAASTISLLTVAATRIFVFGGKLSSISGTTKSSARRTLFGAIKL